MRKSVDALLMVLVLLWTEGCDVPNSTTTIYPNMCWGKLVEGQEITGKAVLEYFPDHLTFIGNTACPSQVILVAAGSDNEQLDIIDKGIDSTPNAFGASVIVDIKGKIFFNKGDVRPLLKPSSMSRARDSQIEYKLES